MFADFAEKMNLETDEKIKAVKERMSTVDQYAKDVTNAQKI